MGKKRSLMSDEEKEKMRLYQIEWRKKNREKDRLMKRKFYLENKDRIDLLERDRQYKKKYGISLKDYNNLLKEQNGVCYICNTDKAGPRTTHFCVDHCHTSGKVRGLLCVKCNASLGWYEEFKQKAEYYLNNQNQK